MTKVSFRIITLVQIWSLATVKVSKKRPYKWNHTPPILPFSSSCFLRPTVFGLPRPLRMGSDWLLARDLLLFSISVVKEESILSLRMRSVLLRFNSSLSAADNRTIIKHHLTFCFLDWPKGFFYFVLANQVSLTACSPTSKTLFKKTTDLSHGSHIAKKGSTYCGKPFQKAYSHKSSTVTLFGLNGTQPWLV